MGNRKPTNDREESDRRDKILAQLQEGWDNKKCQPQVDGCLLIDSDRCATRPHIGLLYQRTWSFQTVSRGFVLGPALATVLIVSFGLLTFLFNFITLEMIALLLTHVDLASEKLENGQRLIGTGFTQQLEDILKMTWFLFLIVFVLVVPPFVAGYFKGKFSLGWESVALDLNGLYHDDPKGRSFTAWSKIFSVRWWGWGFPMTLRLLEGGTVRLYLPRADREWLTKVVKLLIAHHHSDMMGKLPSRRSEAETR